MFSKHRIEALSDGIFAIAMTLLVLDLKVPGDILPGQLGHALRHDGHSYISFVVTFCIASVFWVFQHKLLNLLDKITTASLAPMFVFLGLVSVLPFSTSVWGHHIGERVAFVLYFGNQFAIALALVAQLEVARALDHLRPGLETDLTRLRLYFVAAIMGAAMLAAGLVPVTYVWVAPMLLGITARVLRRRVASRYAVQA